MPHLFHLPSCTPTKSKLYLGNSLAAARRKPDPCRLLTLQAPNLISLFHCLDCTRVSVLGWGLLYECCVTGYVFTVRSCCTSPNPQAGGPPLVGCPWLFIQYFHSYTPYWRPFLHLQPEDTLCHGDRVPLVMYSVQGFKNKICYFWVTQHRRIFRRHKLNKNWNFHNK